MRLDGELDFAIEVRDEELYIGDTLRLKHPDDSSHYFMYYLVAEKPQEDFVVLEVMDINEVDQLDDNNCDSKTEMASTLEDMLRVL